MLAGYRLIRYHNGMTRFIAILALTLCSTALGIDITESLRSGDFWKKPVQESLAGAFVSRPDENHLRTRELQIGELTTGEVVITMEQEKPVSMQAMLYNKGDDGIIGEDDFNNQIASARAAMEELSGTRGKKRSGGKASVVKLQAWEWKWNAGISRLEANASGKKRTFSPEFIRLNIGADTDALNSGGANDNISRFELRNNITTDEDGTVWLKNVPMVDQGQKGYCVPATLARVFAFYGMDQVDQHTLADLCDSKSGGGTSTLDMEHAMKKICKKYHTKFIELEDYASTVKSVVPPYNQLAKREDKPTVDIYSNPFDKMDAEILRKVRTGKTSQVSKWMRDIKKNIDAGFPVIWSVTVGIYQEEIPLPQSRGGHLRLIIGYNSKEKTIIYTDSWGAEHARKTMPAANALSMSKGRYIIRLR
jgi:hypothetical protein